MTNQRKAQIVSANDTKPWYACPPNILTCFRFVLVVPVVISFLTNHRILSLVLYLLACLTDAIDGWVARRFDMTSAWGKAMDPLADKALLLCVIACMCIKGDLGLPVTIIIICKELLMIAGGIVLYGKSHSVIPANIIGKIGTVLFFVAIVFTFLNTLIEPLHSVYRYCMWLAVMFSIFSLIQYCVVFLRGNREGSPPANDADPK